MKQVLKTICGSKGILGEIFESDDGFGFYHACTETTESGFFDFDSAHQAWVYFHEEWFENLPRQRAESMD